MQLDESEMSMIIDESVKKMEELVEVNELRFEEPKEEEDLDYLVPPKLDPGLKTINMDKFKPKDT